MALSQTYVDFATGNDYKGASFVDGAYTSATKTLVKAGAFAATKVNHWLYLESNDGGSIVAGYYKVATVPDANTVTLDTDAGAGVDDDAAKCTQAAGTTALPWRTIQGAVDLCTRNATDGNQVNLLAGTAQVNAAAIDLAVFIAAGALVQTGPLIIRGYTAAANDGGVGEIDCGGATMFAAATYDYVMLADLEIHTFGDNHGIQLDTDSTLFRCEIHKGASSPSGKYLVSSGARLLTVGCYLHDAGAGNARGISVTNDAGIVGNYIIVGTDAGVSYGFYASSTGTELNGNIVVNGSTGGHGALVGIASTVVGNVAYSTAASTGTGLRVNTNVAGALVLNNICVGWSGAGGEGIEVTQNIPLLGYNAFYNNTAEVTAADQIYIDLTGQDVTLAADPFTDAANGDFSLTTAAKAALADKGFPAQYLGAHANTDSHLTIGAIQLTETACDYPAEADVESGVTFSTYTGTLVVPAEADVEFGVDYGAAAEYTGAFVVPSESDVRDAETYGAAAEFTGTLDLPAVADVQQGVQFDGLSKTGTFVSPAAGDVQSGVTYGAAAEFTGTFTEPGIGNVEAGVQYGGGGTEFTGTFAVPAVTDVKTGVTYGDTAEFTGTLALADYPAVGDVEAGVSFGGGALTGTFAVPAVGDVQEAVTYGNAAEFTGTLDVPAVTDVKLGVLYGADGTEFTGTYEASTTVNAITTGNVTTIQGDDYDAADGRQLDWTVASTATLTGGTVAVIIPGVDTYVGSVTSETNIRLELTAAQTAAIPVGKRKYQVLVTQTVALGSDVITVVEGTWNSKARVSE